MTHPKDKNRVLRAIDSIKAFFSGIWKSFMSFLGRGQPNSSITKTASISVSPPSATTASISASPPSATVSIPAPIISVIPTREQITEKIEILEKELLVLRKQEVDYSDPASVKTNNERWNKEEELANLKTDRYTLGSNLPRKEALKKVLDDLMNELNTKILSLDVQERQKTPETESVFNAAMMLEDCGRSQRARPKVFDSSTIAVVEWCEKLESAIANVDQYMREKKAKQKSI